MRIERHIDDLRPDISLWRGERPQLAIEVVVSNAVSPTKVARFLELGVAWIEVNARAVQSWDPQEPLPIHRWADRARCP